MTTVVVLHPSRWLPERRYSLEVLFGVFLGLDVAHEAHDADYWSLSVPGEPRELRMPDVLFRCPDGDLSALQEALRPQEQTWCPPARLGRFSPTEDTLPVMFAPSDPDLVLTSEGAQSFPIDVPGLLFAFLTRIEEHGAASDALGRFSSEASFASRSGTMHRPLVDEHVRLLAMTMRHVWPGMALKEPEFRLWLTHDIDHAFSVLDSPIEVMRRMGGDLRIRRSTALAWRRLRSRVGALDSRLSRDPFNTYDFLMRTAEAHSHSASFLWLVGSPGAPVSPSVDSPYVRSAITSIVERGHEVGLHGAYDAMERDYRFKEETSRLSEATGWPVRTFRQHYLRCRFPDLWRGLADSGIGIDSSAAWTSTWGFRCGTSREYPVFDAVSRRRLEVSERPLIVMDQQLTSSLNENMSHAQVVDAVGQARRECAFHGGCLTLLWHNTEVQSDRQRRLYEQVVSAAV